MYALVTDAPISFPYLFLRSLNEVYRSSSTSHALFFSVFIHRILLHLALDDFPMSEPVHIFTLIGATFLKQRVAQLRASSKRPRVKPSSVAPPPSSSIGDTMAEESVDLAVAAIPPLYTSNDSNIRRMLETIMTVQAAHGQLLVDMLNELYALRVDLKYIRRLPPPPPFDDGF